MCQQKEAAADDHGLMEIYRQMMTVDLFQTQYGGWCSNLSWPLLVAILLGLMGAISFGSYFAYLHWDRVKKLMKKRTVQKTTNNNLQDRRPTRKTPRKSEKLAEADKNEKASQPKTDIGKELIKTIKKSPQATRKTPFKSDKNLTEADKNEKASQPKTDVGKELIKTAQNLEDIHEKIEESNKPVKGMDKLEKVKTAHDKLEKVKKELDQDK